MASSSQKLHCWTASHLGNQERLNVFKLTINNILEVVKPEYYWISLSSSSDLNITELITFLKEKKEIKLYQHEKSLKQFEHLRFLLTKFDGKDSDFILFCDDDDLILRFPPVSLDDKVQVIKGIQYIPNGNESAAVETENSDLKEFLALEGKEGWYTQECDFSGYTARFSLVKEYLSREPVKVAISLEDIKLMEFLDKQEGVITPLKPFVFHRLNSKQDSSWRNQVFQELEILLSQYKSAVTKEDEVKKE
jgi:hypothetical protein